VTAPALFVFVPLLLLAAGAWAVNAHLRHLDRKATRR
jgi:hypothetical protein